MTVDDGVGLRAVYESDGHTGIGGMKQRTLTLNDIPVMWLLSHIRVGERQHRHTETG